MKQVVSEQRVRHVCDLCRKAPARIGWYCFGCGAEVCDGCSLTLCGGVGDCDTHLVCRNCEETAGSEISQKTAELREYMKKDMHDIRERCIAEAAHLWDQWKERARHGRKV